DEVRFEERRVDRVQVRVAVRPVDQRPIVRVELKRMAADADHEVGRVGFTVGPDLVERAAERSLRGERAADALEHAEVGPREIETAVERRVAGLDAVPRAAVALDGTLS